MAISDETCIICGIEILRYHDCPHSAVEAFDYCCPNCNVHYDFNFNIVEEFVGQPTPTTPTTPENPKDNTGSEGKDTTQGQPSENPKENPSQNPSDKDKDKGDSSKAESSQDKSESSKSESSTKSESIPTPPPPTQITSSIKVLQEINSLQSYLATIK